MLLNYGLFFDKAQSRKSFLMSINDL